MCPIFLTAKSSQNTRDAEGIVPEENLNIIAAQRTGGSQRLRNLNILFAIPNNTKNRNRYKDQAGNDEDNR